MEEKRNTACAARLEGTGSGEGGWPVRVRGRREADCPGRVGTRRLVALKKYGCVCSGCEREREA